ncbi:MAG: hypothetical protein AAF799_21555 [Myxococcota bacterium]
MTDKDKAPKTSTAAEPFELTDEMLESVVGGAPTPTASPRPIGPPKPLSVHNWDGHWAHI